MKFAEAKASLKTNFENLKNYVKKEKYFFLVSLLLFVFLVATLYKLEILYVSFAIIVLISALFDFEKSLAILLFCYPFSVMFRVGPVERILLYPYIFAVAILICFVKYFIDVYNGKKEINKTLLIPLFTFLFYITLPFFGINISDIFDFVIFVILFYLLAIYKKDTNANLLIFYAAMGLIISCIFSYLPKRPAVLNLIVPVEYFGVLKFQGLFTNPNMLSGIGLLLLPLIACNFLKKNGLPWILLFVPIFCFCYMTFFRTFLVAYVCMMICLFVFACIKKDKLFWAKYLTLLFVTLVLALCLFDYTRVWVVRMFDLNKQFDAPVINEDIASGIVSPDELSGWYVDGTKADPGRVALWKRYFVDIFSSPQKIIFGVGISENYLGAMPHNGFILYLWTFGIVGVIIGLYAFMPVLLKLFKNFKDEATVSFVICMGIFMFFENIFFGVTSMYMIILFVTISKGEVSNKNQIHSLSKIKGEFLFKKNKKEIRFEN